MVAERSHLCQPQCICGCGGRCPPARVERAVCLPGSAFLSPPLPMCRIHHPRVFCGPGCYDLRLALEGHVCVAGERRRTREPYLFYDKQLAGNRL
jgi:hypothetical protein